MLYYRFKDYEGFKELFGLRECGNGVKTRRNKILLAYLKQHSLLKGAIAGNYSDWERLNIDSMPLLLMYLKSDLREAGSDLSIFRNTIRLNGWTMSSDKYRLDDYKGVCEDKDYKAIRYVNVENGRVFKMKAGKFLKAVMEETEWGLNLPEPVKLWMCEEFTQQWETHTRSLLPEYELHVDDDFERIYDEDELEGDFHSCMTGEGNYEFYSRFVRAKAAYLTNQDGMVIARCVIFTECHLMDGSGRVLRLAERQYSTDCEDVLKRCLVDALIQAGEIDGYKKVGADCHSGHAFVLNDGSYLGHDMWIECTAKDGDVCSYMDSFKWLNTDNEKAYNDDEFEYDADLATTNGYVAVEERNYDSWNDCYTRNDVRTVYYHGRQYTCDEERMDDDFVYVAQEDEYHHVDDICRCEECDGYYLSGNEYHSEITGDDYCCLNCMESAERQYKEDHWTYAQFDGEYFEDEDDVTEYVNGCGHRMTISHSALGRLIRDERVKFNEETEIYEEV